MILSKIIGEKRKEVEKARVLMPEQKLKELAQKIYIKSAFKRNIARPHHINLIAELKRPRPIEGL